MPADIADERACVMGHCVNIAFFFLHSITRRVFARHSSCVRFNFIFVNDILWLLKFLNA